MSNTKNFSEFLIRIFELIFSFNPKYDERYLKDKPDKVL